MLGGGVVTPEDSEQLHGLELQALKMLSSQTMRENLSSENQLGMKLNLIGSGNREKEKSEGDQIDQENRNLKKR